MMTIGNLEILDLRLLLFETLREREVGDLAVASEAENTAVETAAHDAKSAFAD